ncbi:MAG: MamK family actin-like protein [Desulfobulbaceae bacterium]|nr:MamK family actin-like protein [Desulfobulbaceae bacterium]
MSEDQNTPDNQLIIGIDLGTSRTAVMSNRGYKQITRTIVGYPKDIIGIKLLGKAQVFGDEALKNRSALTLYHPLEDGVIRDASERDYTAALELLKHVVQEAQQGDDMPVAGIIGVPSRASIMNKELLLQIANEVMATALVVSEPFMVAYHLNKLNDAIIVDIGAGTVDICGVKGSVPTQKDQITTLKGGDYIDERLESAIQQKFYDVQITRNLVRVIKEQHAFVGEPSEPIKVTLRSDGKPAEYDITREIRSVCESIIPDIVENIISIMKGYDPENQIDVLQNIYLAGGGSNIKGIAAMVEKMLGEYGQVKVTCVADPDFAGC